MNSVDDCGTPVGSVVSLFAPALVLGGERFVGDEDPILSTDDARLCQSFWRGRL